MGTRPASSTDPHADADGLRRQLHVFPISETSRIGKTWSLGVWQGLGVVASRPCVGGAGEGVRVLLVDEADLDLMRL